MLASEHDLERMRRAVALARKGRFAVEPNPVVGAIVEGPGGIVGEGWHRSFGGPHAEREALRLAGSRARGATLYVTLEPCTHHGKTPPCTDAVIESGITRVVYGAPDPNRSVDGGGIERLRDAGIDVVGPVLRDEAGGLLARFEAGLGRSRPWVVAKWAMSLDGAIAARSGAGGAISGRRAGLITHEVRGGCDAVAAGIGTILADDPRLTCRLADGVPNGRSQPARVVFDSELRTPIESRLIRDSGSAPTIVFGAVDADPGRRKGLEAMGCRVELVERGPGGIDLEEALSRLGQRGVRRLLVEGGARIHGALIGGALVDHVHVYVAPLLLGGEDSVRAVSGMSVGRVGDGLRLEDVMWRKVGDDLLMQAYVPRDA